MMAPVIPRAARRGQTWGGPPALRGPASAAVDQMIQEPSAVVGMDSGETKAILGEPTPEYPEGQPEMMTITNAQGQQGPGEPALMQPPATGDSEALIEGFRNMLRALAGNEEGAMTGYKAGGKILAKPKAYQAGGAITVAPGAAGVLTPANASRAAYLAEQLRITNEREAARRRLDSMRPSEQQRLITESEDYKYALGGLARPKSAYELAAETEDQADTYRQFGLDRMQIAAQQAVLTEANSGSGGDGSGTRLRSQADDDDLAFDIEEARQAQEDLAAARRPRYTPSHKVKPLPPPVYFQSGGRLTVNPSSSARMKIETSRAKRETQRLMDARDMADRRRAVRFENDERDIAARMKARSLAAPKPYQSYRDEDIPDLAASGIIDQGQARAMLTSKGYRPADVERDLGIAMTIAERKRSEVTAAAAAKKAAADPRFRYSQDALGRYSDDEILDMAIKGAFGEHQRGQGPATAALRARGYSQEEIDLAWRYAMAKGKKAGTQISAGADLFE